MDAEYCALQLIKCGVPVEDVKDKFYSQFGDDLELILFKALNTEIAHTKKERYREVKSLKESDYTEAANTPMLYSREIVELFRK